MFCFISVWIDVLLVAYGGYREWRSYSLQHLQSCNCLLLFPL